MWPGKDRQNQCEVDGDRCNPYQFGDFPTKKSSILFLSGQISLHSSALCHSASRRSCLGKVKLLESVISVGRHLYLCEEHGNIKCDRNAKRSYSLSIISIPWSSADP